MPAAEVAQQEQPQPETLGVAQEQDEVPFLPAGADAAGLAELSCWQMATHSLEAMQG